MQVCLAFFEKFIVHPCSICLVFFVFADIGICYFMQASIEEVVLEENQIQVVGDPPLPPRYMYVLVSLKKSFSIHVVYVSFSSYYLTLTYVTLLIHILSQCCLKSTKYRLLVAHLSPRGTCMFHFL